MIFYRCTDLRTPPGHVERDPDEQIEPKVYTLAAARTLIARGDIIDMKTVIGIHITTDKSQRTNRAFKEEEPV